MREAEARSEFFGQGKRMSAMAGTGQHLQSETALELNKFLSEHQGDQHTLAAIGTRKAQGLSWKPSVPTSLPLPEESQPKTYGFTKRREGQEQETAAAEPMAETHAQGLVGKICGKLGFLLDPIWHIVSMLFRFKTALACYKSYDLSMMEQLGPKAMDTGDIILFSSAGKGARKCGSCSRWTHVGMVVRNPPPGLVTFHPSPQDTSPKGQKNEEFLARDGEFYIYECVPASMLFDRPHGRRALHGGPQLVPLRHRLAHAEKYSTAALRHLHDFDRTVPAVSALHSAIRSRRQATFKDEGGSDQCPCINIAGSESSQIIALDDDKVSEMEATRAIGATQLIVEMYQCLGILHADINKLPGLVQLPGGYSNYEEHVNDTSEQVGEAGGLEGVKYRQEQAAKRSGAYYGMQGFAGGKPARQYSVSDFGYNSLRLGARWKRCLANVALCCVAPIILSKDISVVFNPAPGLPDADLAPNRGTRPPRLLQPQILDICSRYTSEMDVARRVRDGSVSKRFLGVVMLMVISYLLLHEAVLRTEGPSTGAAVAAAVGVLPSAVMMSLVGVVCQLMGPIVLLKLGSEQANGNIWRAATSWPTKYRHIFHPVLASVTLSIVYRSQVIENVYQPGVTSGIKCGLQLGLGGAMPALLLTSAQVYMSWQQVALQCATLVVQLVVGGWVLGMFYFERM